VPALMIAALRSAGRQPARADGPARPPRSLRAGRSPLAHPSPCRSWWFRPPGRRGRARPPLAAGRARRHGTGATVKN